MTVQDELVIWQILSDKGQAGDQFVSKIKMRLEKALRQDLILVIRRTVETVG